MPSDPTIERIREARRRISEQCGHDPKKLVEYYIRLDRSRDADRLATAREAKQPKNSR